MTLQVLGLFLKVLIANIFSLYMFVLLLNNLAMKTIKSALLGSKSIIDKNPDALLFQLKEILKAHRELILNGCQQLFIRP